MYTLDDQVIIHSDYLIRCALLSQGNTISSNRENNVSTKSTLVSNSLFVQH